MDVSKSFHSQDVSTKVQSIFHLEKLYQKYNEWLEVLGPTMFKFDSSDLVCLSATKLGEESALDKDRSGGEEGKGDKQDKDEDQEDIGKEGKDEEDEDQQDDQHDHHNSSNKCDIDTAASPQEGPPDSMFVSDGEYMLSVNPFLLFTLLELFANLLSCTSHSIKMMMMMMLCIQM